MTGKIKDIWCVYHTCGRVFERGQRSCIIDQEHHQLLVFRVSYDKATRTGTWPERRNAVESKQIQYDLKGAGFVLPDSHGNLWFRVGNHSRSSPAPHRVSTLGQRGKGALCQGWGNHIGPARYHFPTWTAEQRLPTAFITGDPDVVNGAILELRLYGSQ